MRRYLILLVALASLLGVTSLSAQKTERRGFWGEVGVHLGGALSDKAKLGLLTTPGLAGGFYFTPLGIHLPKLNGLQVGVGVYGTTYLNPQGLGHAGVHLDLRYAPFLELPRLQLSALIGLPFADEQSTYTECHTKTFGTLAVGWEFPKVISNVGLSPAVGVSYTSFDYAYNEYALGTLHRGASSQATLFFRLGLRLN